MRYLSEVEPDGPLSVRVPCCGRNRSSSEVRVLPAHGVAFFQSLESRAPGTLAAIGFLDPVPDRICGGCFQKLSGNWRSNAGGMIRLLRKPDALRIVWHGPLPLDVEARAEMWEDRVNVRRGRNAARLQVATNALQDASVP